MMMKKQTVFCMFNFAPNAIGKAINCMDKQKRILHTVEAIADLEAKGYHESMNNCPKCGETFMYKFSSKPFSWESDVTIYKQQYECPYCGYKETLIDSD
jgi:primosomal protein N'